MSNIKTETASFKLTPEMLAQAKAKARSYDMSLSQVLRIILKMLIDGKTIISFGDSGAVQTMREAPPATSYFVPINLESDAEHESKT